MGKLSRTKGAVFERVVSQRLSDLTGEKIQRNIGQARDGGNDIDCPPFVVECKHYASLGLVQKAMTQAQVAALRKEWMPKIPLVVAKANNRPPLAVLDFEDFMRLMQDHPLFNATHLSEIL